MKPSIDEQIEAVHRAVEYGIADPDDPRLVAAIKTLMWVKRHAPLIKTILEEFPGATVNPREEE
jgi:hypothetical protein